MPSFHIKNALGEVINTIEAGQEFVEEHYEFFDIAKALDTTERDATIARNQELKDTDWIVPITDHPQHAQYLAYRQALRDWPSTPDFPTKKPVLGE